MNDFIAWALEKWPFAVVVMTAIGFLYAGLLFDMGPDIIRPVSAQSVKQQITSAKNEVLSSTVAMQQQLSTINNQQLSDRRERLEQQLLWYRQQNCRSKGEARNYTWQKMTELKDRYREITSTDWQMPACSDIGE